MCCCVHTDPNRNTNSTGDFLGEASFVSGKRAGPRSVTAICAGEEGAKYLVWDQASLKEFLSQVRRRLDFYNVNGIYNIYVCKYGADAAS